MHAGVVRPPRPISRELWGSPPRPSAGVLLVWLHEGAQRCRRSVAKRVYWPSACGADGVSEEESGMRRVLWASWILCAGLWPTWAMAIDAHYGGGHRASCSLQAPACGGTFGYGLAPGCCECPPSCCDNAWDTYCEEKARWQAHWAQWAARHRGRIYYAPSQGCTTCGQAQPASLPLSPQPMHHGDYEKPAPQPVPAPPLPPAPSPESGPSPSDQPLPPALNLPSDAQPASPVPLPPAAPTTRRLPPTATR